MVVSSIGRGWGSDKSTSNWLSYGLDASERRFSSLTEINEHNIQNLRLAWSFDLPREARELEATPLAVDGVLYFTTALSVAAAPDLRESAAAHNMDCVSHDREGWSAHIRWYASVR